MKISITLFISTVFSFGIATAQDYSRPSEPIKSFGEGAVAFTAGYGYPNWGQIGINIILDSSIYQRYSPYKSVGPIHFRGEYGLSKSIGLGLSVNYNSFGGQWFRDYYQYLGYSKFYSENMSVKSISLMARFNLHFAVSNQVDPYCGIAAGYKLITYKYHSDYPGVVYDYTGGLPVGFETTIGIRYYFSDIVGIYVEMGFAKSIIQGGISLKL